MIITELKTVLKKHQALSSAQLVAILEASRDEVEAGLEFWIHRGNITVCEKDHAKVCGTACRSCALADSPVKPRDKSIVYQWTPAE